MTLSPFPVDTGPDVPVHVAVLLIPPLFDLRRQSRRSWETAVDRLVEQTLFQSLATWHRRTPPKSLGGKGDRVIRSSGNGRPECTRRTSECDPPTGAPPRGRPKCPCVPRPAARCASSLLIRRRSELTCHRSDGADGHAKREARRRSTLESSRRREPYPQRRPKIQDSPSEAVAETPTQPRAIRTDGAVHRRAAAPRPSLWATDVA